MCNNQTASISPAAAPARISQWNGGVNRLREQHSALIWRVSASFKNWESIRLVDWAAVDGRRCDTRGGPLAPVLCPMQSILRRRGQTDRMVKGTHQARLCCRSAGWRRTPRPSRPFTTTSSHTTPAWPFRTTTSAPGTCTSGACRRRTEAATCAKSTPTQCRAR